MLPSYENLVEAAYKIEAIDAGISEAVHSTQWAWYTLGITRPLMSPFEWVPEQLSRFLTDPTIATLLEHPGQ